MFRRRTLLLLAAPILGFGLVGALQIPRSIQIENEPVLVYDVTGSTLLGPVHRHLAVYNSGNTSYATLGPLNAEPFVGTAQVDVERVETLMSQLSKAGAWQALDQDHDVTDVPLTTVTVLGGATDARAHSFSYWIPTHPVHKSVQDVIEAFVAEVFHSTDNPYTTPGG